MDRGAYRWATVHGVAESDTSERLHLTSPFPSGIRSASLVAQRLKRLSPMLETWVQSLGWKDPLEKGMASHSSILAWRIPMDSGAWWTTIHGVAESDMTEFRTQAIAHIGLKEAEVS